jgi:RNA polymerase sigma factor FliA
MKEDTSLLWNDFRTTRSIETRNILIIEYRPFVKIMAHKIFKTLPDFVDFSDLISYGYLGLMDAIEKYDCERNIKFEAYASFRIRGAILDGLRELDWLPRTLRTRNKKNNKSQYESDAYSDGFSKSEKIKPDNKDNIHYSVFSFDDENQHEKEKIFSDNYFLLNGCNHFLSPADFTIRLENELFLTKAITNLKKHEKKVVDLYYYREKTFKEIGNVLGVTESRVCQIHKKALQSLKSILSGMC